MNLKRWNWGAFLLAPLWCIRHRVWQGLLLFIPFLGLFVPFYLGAKGSEKAWDGKEPVEAFLKRQRRWGRAGLVVWGLALAFYVASLAYFLNYSEGIKMGLEIANSNKRLTDYLGNSIQKASFFQGSYDFEDGKLAVEFHATGTNGSGDIHFQWEKRGDDWVATAISLGGKSLVHSPTLVSSFASETPFTRGELEKALDRIIKEKEGFVVLSRSKENNDFIQTAARVEDGKVVFSIVYSDGYTELNKQLYQSKSNCDKEEALKLFTHYALGDDSHRHSIEWNKLVSIEPVDETNAYFIFG